MKIKNFLPRVWFSFSVCALMAFITIFVPAAVGNETLNVANWNEFSLWFLVIGLLIGFAVSIFYSVDMTDENRIGVGDIPKSYNLRTLNALLLFESFSIIAFFIVYTPFAIAFTSINPAEWGTFKPVVPGGNTLGTPAGWCALIMFVAFCFSIGYSWEFAGRTQKK